MPNNNRLEFDITANTKQAETASNKLGDTLEKTGEKGKEAAKKTSEEFSGMGGVFKNLEDKVKELGEKYKYQLAVLGAIGGAVAVIKESVDEMIAWDKAVSTANQLSAVGTKTAAAYALGLKQVGFEAEDATGALQAFGIRFQEAKDGGEDATKALSLFIKDADQLKKILADGDVGEALLQVADNMDRVGNTSQRVFALDTLLGGDSEKFVQFAGSLRELTGEAERLNLVFSPEKSAEIREYSKQLAQMGTEWDALKVTIGQGALPVFKESVTFFREAAKENTQWYEYYLPLLDATIGKLVEQHNEEWRASERALKGQQILATATDETREEIEDYAKAVGYSVEEAAYWTAGSLEVIKTLKDQRQAVADAREEQEKLAEQARAEAQALADAAAQKQKYAEDTKAQAAAAAAAIDEQTKALDTLRTDGEVNAIQYAERLAEIKTKPYDLEVKAAEAALAALRANGAAGLVSEADFSQKLIEINAQLETARVNQAQATKEAEAAIDTAYAEKRAGDLAAYQKELDSALKSELDAIDKRKTSYLGAEQAKIEASENRIQQEIDLLDKQLTSERVTAEEKKQLLAQVDALQAQYAQLQEDRSARLAEAERRDAAEYYNQQSDLADEKIAKVELEIAQAQRRGATEQEVAAITARARQTEIEAIDVAISRAQSEGDSETHILQLKAQRERAEMELAQAHAAASSQIIAGEEAQQAAIQETTDATNAARQAQEANVAGAMNFIASLTAYAQGATRETIDKMEANLQKALTEAANTMAALGAGQIAGLLEYYGQQAQAAFNEIQKKRKEFEAEDRREREAARKAEEERAIADAQREQERINAEIEKARADAQRAENQRRKEERANEQQFQEDLKQITIDGLEAIQDAEESLADIRVRQAEDEATRLLQVEKDLQSSREKAILDSRQKAADDEASRVQREIEAKRKLAEAQASGDVEGAEEAQGELADIEAERDREKRRAEEEALARQQATSEEELAILLDAINEKFSREEDFYARKKALGEDATEEERKATEAAYQAQLAAIQAAKQAQLDELANQKAEEERLRQEARAKELADAQQAITDAQTALDQQLTARKEAYAKQQEEFDRAAEKERNAHAKLMADLEAQARAGFEKMAEYARGYFSELEKGNTSGAGSGAGGGNTSGGTPGLGGGPSNTAPPPPPPPPSSPPPNTQTGGGRGRGGGGRGQGRGNNQTLPSVDLKDPLKGTPLESQWRDYIDGKIAPLDMWNAVLGAVGAGTISDLRADAALEAIRQRDLDAVSIDLADLPPGRFGTGGDLGATGGTPGELTTTGPGRQSPGPPATPPASTPPPKAERDPVVASNLEFKADNIRTKNDREAVIEAANKALELGKIDQQDMGRIKSHADFQSFQAGVDIGGGSSFSSGGTTSLQAVGGSGGSGGGIRPVSAASGSTPAPAGSTATGNQLLGGVARQQSQPVNQTNNITGTGQEIMEKWTQDMITALTQAGIII